MSVVLPYPAPTAGAAGWALSDWRELQLSTAAADDGRATLELPQVPSDEVWLIDRAVAACDSAAPTQLRLSIGAVHALALRDGTSRGNFDVTEYPQGLLVRPSTQLLAQWTGAADGAVGVLTVQLRVFRRG
jgi:hypothetical protein